MDKLQINCPQGTPVTVHFNGNPGLRTRGASFHWWDAEYTSLHDHDYYEFFIITSGSTNHILNGRQQELPEKTLCLIRPRDCHQFTPIPGQSCIHINLPVTAEKLRSLCAAIGTTLEQLLSWECRQLRLSDSEFSFFKRSARELNYLQETGDNEEFTSMIICEMLIHAVVILSRQHGAASDGAPEWLNQLLRRIHSPEYISCRVSDIYALAGYSPPVVIRAFRRYTGETVVSYLTRAKLEYAKRLLTSTNLTVLDIAGRLGYSSLSHFNKLFRESTLMSPREYRMKYRE